MHLIADLSSLFTIAAALVGLVHLGRARPRRGWFLPLILAFAALAGWTVLVSFYVREPFSALRVRYLLGGLCVALVPWLAVALTLGAGRLRDAVGRWRVVLGSQVLLSIACAAVVSARGIDWITGIGAEPAVVVTRWGIVAVGLASTSAVAAVVVLAARFRGDLGTMPAVAVGCLGAIGSLLWVSGEILWRGYLTPAAPVSAAAVAAVAATAWGIGVLRQLPIARPLAPSRRLVYGAVAAGLGLAYVVAARFALEWVAAASAAMTQVVPALVFATAAGLLITLASPRSRHLLWVAIGRHLFRSKHDYGAIWIHLTNLIIEARDAADLLQRAATFCREVLCVPSVAVWLTDATGSLRRVALAAPGQTAVEMPRNGSAVADGAADNGAVVGLPGAQGTIEIAERLGCAFASPMRVNGTPIGFVAVGEEGKGAAFDGEDRRLVEYIAAQVASALELYRLGEQIADAREVDSFNRLSAFVIHDLKNLVAQQSFVLENAGKFKENPRFVADAIEAFTDSTSRMRSLIGRLGAREPARRSGSTSCDLVAMLQELTARTRLGLQDGCTVRVEVPDGVATCLVRADPAALTQVFTNLLVNAVESLLGDEGEVAVRIRPAAEAWQVEVCDNGRGVPEEFLRNHLFRPFQTTKESGLGIGLYQCKTVVEAAGGKINVRSRANAGTAVVVTLPRAVASDDSTTVTGEDQDGKTNAASH